MGKSLTPGSVKVGDRVWITNDVAGGWTQIRGRVTAVRETGATVDISPFVCGGQYEASFPFRYLFATVEDAHPGEPWGWDSRDAEEWESVQEEFWAEGRGPADMWSNDA